MQPDPTCDVNRTVILVNLTKYLDNAIALAAQEDTIKYVIRPSWSDVVVSQTERLLGKNDNSCLVKVTLDSLNSQIKVVSASKSLPASHVYNNVWIRSSKTHIKRLLEISYKGALDLFL